MGVWWWRVGVILRGAGLLWNSGCEGLFCSVFCVAGLPIWANGEFFLKKIFAS